MKLMDNLTTGRKLAIMSAAMIALTILAIYSGAILLQATNEWTQVKDSTNQLSSLFFEQSSNLRGYIISGDQSFLDELNANTRLFQEKVQEAKTFTNDPEIQNALEKFQADEQGWHEEVANPVIELRKKVNAGQASLQELNQRFLSLHYGNFLLAEFSIRKDGEDLVALAIQKTEVATSQARIVLLTILTTEVTIGIVISLGVRSVIIRPLRKLQDSARMLQKLQDVAGFDFVEKPSRWEAIVNVVSRIRRGTFEHQDETVRTDLPEGKETFHPLKFDQQDASKAFQFLAQEFLQDYTFERLSLDVSGWRTALKIAEETKLSANRVYGKGGIPGSALAPLLKRGLVEARYFPGQRGRGGTVMKVRANYGNPYVKEEIDQQAKEP